MFVIDDLVYVTQVSSPKPRHNKLKDTLDFIKLFESQKLLAVINLNYMFPVPKKELMNLEYKNIDKYVNFADKIQENNYIHLLKKEMSIIQGKPLTQNAIKIYNLKSTNPNHSISKRSLDFKRLDELANEYSKTPLLV